MATLDQQKEYKAAVASGDKSRIAAAEKAAMSNSSGNGSTAAGTKSSSSSSDRDRSNTSVTPTLAAAIDPAKQKADQAYINSTVKGGLASYAKNQQDRYNTADPTLRAALEADAKRVGISLAGSSAAKTQQVDNRSAREKYGTPTDPVQLKALEDYEKELKEKGNARLPDYLQDASGQYQDDLMAANRNRFYQENSKNWGDAQKGYYAEQEAQIARNGGSVSKAIMNNDYMATVKFDGLTGQEGAFNWQTGKVAGDVNMLDPKYNNRLDQSIGGVDRVFKTSFDQMVNNGEIEDTPENRQWYEGYKKEWAAKNQNGTGFGEGMTLNPTLAALISQQAEGKKDIQTQAVPAGAPPQAKQTPATSQANNQTAYLEGLVKAGGGNAEWAKAQLAKMGVTADAQTAPATTPSTTPATTPGTVSVDITPQQAAGTDWAATWKTAVQNGDIDAMEEAVKARGVKLQGMNGVTEQMLADQRKMEADTKAAREKFNTANPTGENALESKLLENMAASDKESQAIIKQLEDFKPIELEEAITWEVAMQQAKAQLDPKYDQARLERLAAIDKDAVKRGFYGQMPTSKRKLTDSGMLENDRAAAVATLAQSILGMSKDDAYKKATFQASERQATLSNLLAQLQARQGLSQQNTSILSALLQSAQNKTAQKQNQANADRAYNLEKTQMDFSVENMKKQWGYNDAEAARAEKEFNFKVQAYEQDLQKGRIQIANSLKSGSGSGSGSSSGSSKDAAAAAKVTEALRKEQIANTEQARKIADSTVGSAIDPDKRQAAWNAAYNKALNDLNQRTEDFYKGLL